MNKLPLLHKRVAHNSLARQVLRQNRPRSRHESSQTPKQDRIDVGASRKVEATQAQAAVRSTTTPSPAWYQRLGPVSDFLAWFHRTQTRRPYTVQFCSTTVVYLAGDLSAQRIGGEEYDPWRTVRMLVIGGIASIPGYKW